MSILISQLLVKPADLDLHCFSKRVYYYNVENVMDTVRVHVHYVEFIILTGNTKRVVLQILKPCPEGCITLPRDGKIM